MDINDMSITGDQCKQARELTGLSPRELSAEASIASFAVAEFEAGVKHPCAFHLRNAFERLGVEFADDGIPRLHDGVRGEYRPEWLEARREWQIRVGTIARQALGDFTGNAQWGPDAVELFQEFPIRP